MPSLPKVPSTPRDGSFIRNFVVAKKGGFVCGGQKHEEEGELNEKEWAEEREEKKGRLKTQVRRVREMELGFVKGT